MIDAEIGFTSDVITDPERFVGRANLLRKCIKAINSPLGLIAVFGKRGVGKSSLLRQIQKLATGDYALPKMAGLRNEIPPRPRTYLTVYHSCDALISDSNQLLERLCNDQHHEDGLLRLVPNDGKEIEEFSRSKEASTGFDLKVTNWGAKGVETSKYVRVVPNNTVQTFKNYLDSIVVHQVKKTGRDGLLIILDEFDVIKNKKGIGSLIKSLTSDSVKFAVCGIARDMYELVEDHSSVERLLEEGAINVAPMPLSEAEGILSRAERLFKGQLKFEPSIIKKIAQLSQGYPYLTQLFGKECVSKLNSLNQVTVNEPIFEELLQDIKRGEAFPTLEDQYQRAIGSSKERQMLLHLMAEQDDDGSAYGRVALKSIRADAPEFQIDYMDQLLPRLVERKYGPILARIKDQHGQYEFVNPVFRIYVKLRRM